MNLKKLAIANLVVVNKIIQEIRNSMLTVLLATRNRAGILREVLETYCRLQPPGSGWKLVVVDNGSTDDTSEVIASFVGRLPLQSVVEPSVGKNCALNTGLPLIEGDLVVFSDDDVFPRSDWLIELRKAADHQEAYAIFGGTILPRWEVAPPKWVEWLDLAPIFTITPSWMKEGELAPDYVTLVQGPNMALRSNVFRSGARFDPSIGPRGSEYAMGSETELILRFSRQGYRAWYVQSSVVEHFVRKEQMDENWILRRAIRWGRGFQRLHPNPKLWWGIPRHLYRDLTYEALHASAAWTIGGKSETLLRSRWRFNFLLGIAIESRIMTYERRSKAQSVAEVVPRNR